MAFDLPGVKLDSDIETLFKTVGFVVIQWGQAEQNLDLMVARLFHLFEGHPLFKKRPRNLKPKVKFLRDCFAKLPELKQFRAESDTLLVRFLKTGEKRNDLVHGGIASLSINNGQFTFVKMDVDQGEHHSIRSVVLDQKDWPAFRTELLHLGRDWQSLAKRVSDSLKERQ